MRAIIVGAGEVGKQLARVLSDRKNDVVVIDTDEQLLEQLKDSYDIMTVPGNGAAARTLVKAGIDRAELLLAVTNNSEANIMACMVAKQFEVSRKIARIKSSEYFDHTNNLAEAAYGIDIAIIPEYECATNIMDALMRPAVKETVKFSHPDAQMINFQIQSTSPMVGARLSNFPQASLLQTVRVCAIVRYGQLIIPRGQTSFMAHDEIYVAGAQNRIDDLITWAAPEQQDVRKVIIAGSTHLGRMLASMLITFDIRVVLIEANSVAAQQAADSLGTSAMILAGESTELAVLREAGIDTCDAFIACHQDNETNILSCLLAKREGASKVITVTNHPDYIRIIAGMQQIDCGFSPLVETVNLLIQHISPEKRRTVALLKRTPAEVLEMTVDKKSGVANRKIKDIDCPREVVFGLILRDGSIVPAIGEATLKVGDHVVVLARSEVVEEAEKLFSPRRFF